jgi:hypothetical protein
LNLAGTSESVSEVVETICSAVAALDERIQARCATLAGTDNRPSDEKQTSFSQPILDWGSGRRLISAAESSMLEDQTATDDLGERAVWAQFNSAPWPGRVVPLCLAPQNILAMRTEADTDKESCLVRFYGTNNYSWVQPSKLEDFWRNYDDIFNEQV